MTSSGDLFLCSLMSGSGRRLWSGGRSGERSGCAGGGGPGMLREKGVEEVDIGTRMSSEKGMTLGM